MANTWTPSDKQIKSAPEHIAWAYAALLAAAMQMAEGHSAPINHQVQEAFLVHVRNLSEFFFRGVDEFKKDPSALPKRADDNVYAVDLCSSVKWSEAPFHRDQKLLRAINKTLSHITYSRDLSPGNSSKIDLAFDGSLHAHGTVRLLRKTWIGFMESLRHEFRQDLLGWLNQHADGMKVPLSDFDQEFDRLVRRWPHWILNQTPDGPL